MATGVPERFGFCEIVREDARCEQALSRMDVAVPARSAPTDAAP